MKTFLFLMLFSFSVLSDEIKLQFNKADSLVGEVLPASVTGFNSEPIENKRIGDDLYIVSMNEKFAEVIFLKKLTSNQVMLDQTSTITWSPIELKEVQLPQGISLLDQKFELNSKKTWIIVLVVILLLLAFALKYCLTHIKPKKDLRKRKQTERNKIFEASTYNEVTDIWKKKHQLIEMFPGIEEAFLKFEVEYYRVAFRPEISDDDKKQIEKKYQHFLDLIRGINLGI